MLGKRGADIQKYRAQLILSPRPTRHPGSKPGRIPAEHKTGAGNTWRAMTRTLRSYPGWKKRLQRLAREEQARASRTVGK